MKEAVTVCCQAGELIPDSVINVFQEKKKKMNNSKQTSDRLVKTGKATVVVWLA